jgi:hypothetical protein
MAPRDCAHCRTAKRQRHDVSFLSDVRLTVFWENEGFPGHVTVAISNFPDRNFPAPTIAVWEETRHPWVSLPPDTPPNRAKKRG